MGRRILKGASFDRPISVLRRRRGPVRPGLERLEDRTMLDAGVGSSGQLPAAIVVGRTLSAYDVPDVQNNQETITYTVYNEQADPVSGVLLTTTLQPGVTFAGASQQPDRSGQNLAWSLGAIGGFGRASVSLTVSLATPTPTQLDGGAEAFGTLDGGAVAAATPAATLRATAIPAALLASTPDANTTDPFIQEEAAKLSYDPQQIFNFLHTQVGYNAYTGSVRGARGTLWSGAGNALDVASLGVALMRASGIPAQYVQGTLSYSQAQQLILSMFPASYQTVGYVPSGTSTADPANDGTLQSQTQNHYWFQFDVGNGMLDADPLMSGAAIGKTFTTPSGTFSVVPDDQREKVEIKLNAEMYSQASALFGLSGLSTTTVLDQTFNDVDLVGHPLTIGHFVNTSGGGFLITAVTNTYSPYVEVGDEAYPDSSRDEVLKGTPYQEVFTNFPFGTQILTGLFLDMTLSGPEGASQTYERALVDRLGPAIRQNGGTPNLSVGPNSPPALTDFDLVTILATPGLQDPRAFVPLQQQLMNETNRLQQLAAGQPSDAAPTPEETALMTRVLRDTTVLTGINFLSQSDVQTSYVAGTAQVAAYADRPRLTLVSNRVDVTAGTSSISIDLRRDTVRVLAAPGQAIAAVFDYTMMRGFMEAQLENDIFATQDPNNPQPGVAIPVSTVSVFNTAQAQGIPFTSIGPGNLADLDSLNISADAKALIASAVADGKVVYVPTQSVSLNGIKTVAWYEIDPNTGETIGVTEDGGHQDTFEYAAAFIFFSVILAELIIHLFPRLAGQIVGLFLVQDYNAVLMSLESKAVRKDPGDVFGYIPPGAEAAAQQKALNYIKNRKVQVIRQFYKIAEILDFKNSLILKKEFETGVRDALSVIQGADPPVGTILVTPAPDTYSAPTYAANVVPAPALAAGAVAGNVSGPSLSVTGTLSASWQDSNATGFMVSSLNAPVVVVTDSNGRAVGSGVLSLSSSAPASASVAGSVSYGVSGTGNLSFYAGANNGSSLSASGTWDSYSATVTGQVTITITTAGLVLNGQALPAGTYTIATSSATLAGSGPSTAPDFAGSASVDASVAQVELGPGSGGGIAVGGKPLDPSNGITLDGFAGNIGVSPGGAGAEAATLSGSAANVLTVSAGPAALATDQNTPVAISANVLTSLADTYAIKFLAPGGWNITTDSIGNVIVTPAPGTQGGTYPIRIVATSATDPNLVAQTIVNVTVNPTQPGLTMGVAPDPLFTVPVGGANLASGYQVSLQNTGPVADTYNLTFPSPPPGFTVVAGKTSVTVPAGQTGIVGVYLVPTGPLPAPGTQVSFTVTATSTTDKTITRTQTLTFTVPAVEAATFAGTPAAVSTTPGAPVSATLTLTNVGNVPTTVSLADELTANLSGSPLSSVSLAVGQTMTETLTLTPDPATPLNSTLDASVSATFGPSDSPTTLLVQVPVQVVAPGVAAISAASVAERQLGNTGLVTQLTNLGTALTNVFQDPANPVYRGQATAAITSLVSQVTGDPFLSSFAAGLTAAQAALAGAASAADVQAAIANLGTALTSLASVISDDAQHGFTLSLSQDRLIAQPNQAETFNILLTNNGSAATTYDFSVSGLPAGVTASFSQNSVTLQPGGQVTASNNPVTLSLTETGTTLIPAGFTVTATAEGASEITRSTAGQLTLRDTSLLIAGVTTNPPYTPAGGQVQVSAKVQSAVNQPETVTVSYVVDDPSGKTIFTSSPVSLPLDVTTSLTTANLGTFDTTGLADGIYTVVASLADPSGRPVPGGVGQGYLVVGLPVTATVTTTPTTVPSGSDTVTTTVQVHGQMTFPDPLTLLGQVATGDNELSTVLYTNNLAYEVGNNGIAIVDVGDSSNPKLLSTFATDTIVKGGFNVAQIVGHDLLVASTITLNASGFQFIVYDLTDPMNPTLVSNTNIPFRFFAGMFVLGDVALFPLQEVDFFPAGANTTYFAQQGNILSVDISDLAHPKVLGEVFSSNDPHEENGAVIVNGQVAYTLSTTDTGGDTSTGVGNLLMLDITNPAAPTVTGNLNIPDTNTLSNIAIHGDTALVVGSSGGLLQPFDFGKTGGLTGNVTLTVLDISDPANPKVLGSTLVTEATSSLDATLPPGRRDLVDLGNGLFALSNVLENGNPAILLINASDPNNIIVGAVPTPALYNGLTVSGSTLYVGTPTGLATYDIGPLVSSPVTISVQVPKDSANLALVANSFNKPPTQIISGTTSDTYVWDRELAFGNTDLSFSWQTKLSNVNPGDTPAVTLGTTVGFVNQGTPGTVSLAGTTVTGAPIISVTPASQTAQPGGTATYDVRLENPSSASVSYNLGVLGAPGTVNVPSPVTVPAGGTVDVPLTITPSTFAIAGDSTITVTAEYIQYTSDFQSQIADFKGTATATLTVAGAPLIQPDPVAHGVVVGLTPLQPTAGQGGSARYVVRLTNTGSADDSYSLQAAGLPEGVFAQFSSSFVEVPPGAGNFREVTLTLTDDQGTSPGAIPFQVVATAESKAGVTGSASGTLTVTAGGVDVSLSPGSGAPGSGFQLFVTNTGTVADTYSLALAGPAAPAASLGVNQVTLAPGDSQTIPITTGPVNFAVPGGLQLVAMATSQADANIRAADTAALTIPTTQGLTAQFQTANQVLSAPGTATFLLQVNNTGNAEDAYTATIVGANGPVAASLVGLDGLPTQAIPTFRLPGLGSGMILLRADLAALGTGAVTVMVQSQGNPALVASATATLSAQATTGPTPTPTPTPSPTPGPSPTPTPTPGVVDGPVVAKFLRYGYHQAPTTLVLSFDEPLDPARAQDVNNYRIIGPDGRTIRVAAAFYDPATLTVSLSPVQRLDVHRRYTLIIIGTGPAGVAGADGLLLDGARTGQPGSNFVTTVTFSNVVLGARAPSHPSAIVRPAVLRRVAIVVPHRTAVLRQAPVPRTHAVHQVHLTASAVDHALASVRHLGRRGVR